MPDPRTTPLRRRPLLGGALAAMAPALAPGRAWAQRDAGPELFLAAVGPEIAVFRIGPAEPSLTRIGGITMPAPVQYAWRHPRLPLLYVVYSRRASGQAGTDSGMSVLRIGADGRLSHTLAPVPLAQRPINTSVDPSGQYILVAYNNPSTVTVHRLAEDGQPGPAVPQAAGLDTGVYAHQVRFTPDGGTVILVTRGNDAAGGRPEDPGALKVFRFAAGQLTNLQSVAPGNGFGFGPRHLDFHPTKPWVFVSLERENLLMMFLMAGGRLAERPSFTARTVADRTPPPERQLVGPIHVSHDGRFVYLGNRADGTREVNGHKVFAGGENTIVAFRIDADSGEPTLVQAVEPRSIHPRTFGLDRTGTVLVSATIAPIQALENATVVDVPAALSVFRVRPDGLLDYVRKYDMPTGNEVLFWAGTLAV